MVGIGFLQESVLLVEISFLQESDLLVEISFLLESDLLVPISFLPESEPLALRGASQTPVCSGNRTQQKLSQAQSHGFPFSPHFQCFFC